MRILIFSWRDPKHPLAGGAEQIIHEHAKGWIRAGHKVTLFASRYKNSLKEEIIGGIQITRGGHQYLGVQLLGWRYYLKNKKDFDLIIDQFHGLPFFTPLFVRKPILAVIQETARGVWFLNPFSTPLNWLVGTIGFLTEPLIFLIYKKTPFMTGSDSAKDDLAKMGIPQKNITVINHGVLVESLNPQPPKEKKLTITFLGLLSKDKGIEDAIECFHKLYKKGDFQFWVIGKPETKSYGEFIKRKAKKLGQKVRFWGFVSQEKKFELLAASHLLVNPSIREGWGLVNIEANSVGTPVVAYSSVGLIDSVKDQESGLICKNTPGDLARTVEKVLVDKSLLKKLQGGALKWSRQFSWPKSVRMSLKLLEKVQRPYSDI